MKPIPITEATKPTTIAELEAAGAKETSPPVRLVPPVMTVPPPYANKEDIQAAIDYANRPNPALNGLPGNPVPLPHIVREAEPVLPPMLPTDKQERKHTPITTGCLDYFPLAIAAVAQLSRIGNEQHNPGQPLHWAREKSTDHADCIARHLIERGTIDTDGVRHSAKVAWRALAMLQLELEAAERTYNAA